MDRGTAKELFWNHWMVRYLLRPLIVIYLLFALFALFFSDTILFPGDNGRSSYQDTEEILKLTTSDGLTISARYLPHPSARYTILFSHGNGEDLGTSAALLQLFAEAGFAVFAYDYHGYGTSQGTATEENTYRDIAAAYDYLTNSLQVPSDRIIVFGRSLGGGPSVDLAARKPVAGLILESTFASAYRVYTNIPMLPFDKFRNQRKMARVRCPVLVIHGRADRTIPLKHGMLLFNAAIGPKEYLWINGAGHNDVPEVAGEAYRLALQNFSLRIDEHQQNRIRPVAP